MKPGERSRSILRLIVQAFLDCKQMPTVRAVAKQYRHETGEVADPDEVEEAIRAAGR
jgi:hypothetical protein